LADVARYDKEHKMSSLILNSLEIEGFRAFEHLTIERLGRVNLIVGKNNVGKSCFLEALRVYVRRGSPETIQYILYSRDESDITADSTELDVYVDAVKYLFYERKAFARYPHIDTFKIGPIGDACLQLVVSTQWDENAQASFFGDVGNFLPDGVSITFGRVDYLNSPFRVFRCTSF
jgi:hypothetical protein